MRKNLPITQNEYVLRDAAAIVSKTDLKGRITYVNPYFIEVSGFSREELIGSPHNLVRHPDMPSAAFADLWATLKDGLPWTGIVKNRRKNGDYYWVKANVTPIRADGKVTGYMSARTRPSRAEVKAAEALYRSMREGNSRFFLHHGHLVRTGWGGLFARLQHASLNQHLAWGMGAQLLAVCALVAATATEALPSFWLAALGALPIAGCLLLWRWLAVAVAAPLKGATQTARAIAGGDLTCSFETSHRGDFGRLLGALQQMNINLQALIGDVRSNIDAIGVGAREIAIGNMGLAHRTESQSASLAETAASMEQLAAIVKRNADSAEQGNGLGAAAMEVARRGGEATARVVGSMQDISTASHKVVDIVALINSIAFQTNLLALNAAVEAARAGVHGRGFAVVAQEVRELARRSAHAAGEIKALIEGAINTVDVGGELVQRAGTTMEEIVTAVSEVGAILADVRNASGEQRTGIEHVNRAVTQMEAATVQNVALVEQAAMAAQALTEQVDHLAASIEVFRLKS